MAGPDHHGRVDAAIYQPGRALLVIEVKVGEHFDHAQLVRHARDWGVTDPRAHSVG